MRKGKRGQKVIPSANRGALNPRDRLRQQAYGLRNARNFAQAKPLLEELYRLEPDNMPLALDLGEAYMETEDFGSATSLYAKLIENDPKNINAVTNLGGSLIRLGKLEDARAILEYALQLDPKSIHARINLGSVLQASGERKANLDNALEAVQIDPSSSLAFNNLGSAFSDMAMFKEARHAYETAVMLDSEQIDALINLAAIEARLGDSRASAEMYERVIKKLPKEAEQRIEATKFYAAFEYLKQGVLEKGWDYYEGGFSQLVPAKGARTPRRNFDVPRWDGQPLNGKTLLVWREQGLGDELLFATCLHELEALGGSIIVECDVRLVTIFQRSFPQYTIRAETFLPNQSMSSPFSDFDLHLPMGSLMKYFRRDIKDFERSGTYIKPDPLRVADFQKRLKFHREKGRLVGICWRSGKLDPVRNLSYTTLDEWGEDVLQQSGHVFINLQYGECEEELCAAETKYGVTILRWKDLDLRNDLEGVFALMACLDGVVSVQTAVLVMAGAVGRVSLGLRAGGWTMLGRKASAWFDFQQAVPTVKRCLDELEWTLIFTPPRLNSALSSKDARERFGNDIYAPDDVGKLGSFRALCEELVKGGGPVSPLLRSNSAVNLATRLALAGCKELASQLMDRAYELDSSLSDGFTRLASFYKTQKDWHAAYRCIEKDLTLGRLTSQNLIEYSVCSAYSLDSKEKISYIARAYDENKNLKNGYAQFAGHLIFKGDWSGALELLIADCDLKRMTHHYNLVISELLARQGAVEAAIDLVKNTYDEFADLKDGYVRIARALTQAQNWREAHDLIRLDESLGRITPRSDALRAIIEAKCGSLEHAKQIIAKNYSENKQSKNFYLALASSLISTGDWELIHAIAWKDRLSDRATPDMAIPYARIAYELNDWEQYEKFKIQAKENVSSWQLENIRYYENQNPLFKLFESLT